MGRAPICRLTRTQSVRKSEADWELPAFLKAANAGVYRLQECRQLAIEAPQHLECVLVGIVELFRSSFRCLAEMRSSCAIGLCDSPACSLFCIAQERLAALVCLTDNSALLNQPPVFFFGTGDNLCRCLSRFLQNLVARLQELRRLPQICGNSQPQLIDEIEHALSVDNQVAAYRQPARLDDKFFEAIDQFKDFQLSSLAGC